MSQHFDELDVPVSDSQSGVPGIVGIIWRRKALLLLGAILGLIGGAVYFSQQQIVYQSTARVLIIKKQPNAIPMEMMGPRYSFYEDYLTQQLLVMKSTMIVGRAVDRGKLSSLKTFANDPSPLSTIMRNLDVTKDEKGGVGSTSILHLAYSGPVPEDCPVVLKAIMASYNEWLNETYRDSRKELKTSFERTKDLVLNHMEKARQELHEFRKSSPVIARGKDGGSLQHEHLAMIEAKRFEMQMKRSELEHRLQTIQEALKNDEDPRLLLRQAMLANPTAGDENEKAQLPTLEDQLQPYIEKEQELLTKFGEDHYQVKAVRRKIKLLRQRHEQKAGHVDVPIEELQTRNREAAKKMIDSYVASLNKQIADLAVAERAFSDMFEKEHETLKSMAQYEYQEEDLKKQLDNLQRLLDETRKTDQALDLVKSTGGYDSKVLSPPGMGQQIAPRATPIFLMSMAFGLLGGLGLAWAAEVTDKSFKNPEEIRRRLGMPVVGHVPLIVPDKASMEQAEEEGHALDPVLCCHYRSKSVQAEAFRGIRTWLYFNTAGKSHKVLQVTSPNKGDGKSTLAANLAISIAQSGKSLLLIDADFRRPRQHKLFGLSDEVGLASVMSEDADLNEAIRQTAVPNLSLLPCGPRPANPAELLTAPRFKELLDQLGERYDFVLVDTPPLLVVSDPGVVAPRVDGVLLAIRVSKNGRPDAERAKESLMALNANVLGVVVNGVGARGHYGAGKAYYDYQYAYNYAYTYRSYEDYADDGYYQEEPVPDAASKNG